MNIQLIVTNDGRTEILQRVDDIDGKGAELISANIGNTLDQEGFKL